MPINVDEVLETYWDDLAPLRNPVMLVALRGLFDIGGVATSALDWMLKERDATVVSDIDPDPFFTSHKSAQNKSLTKMANVKFSGQRMIS
jgi:hypothetical protein